MPKQSKIRQFFVRLGLILFVVWIANIFILVSFGNGSSYEIRAAAGTLLIMTGSLPDDTSPSFGIHWGEYAKGIELRICDKLSDFEFFVFPRKWISQSIQLFLFPIWWLGLPFMFFSLVSLLQNSRRPINSCLFCGYNLTGNVSGVCPECGKPIEPEKLTGRGIG
jgi:hypothetical protein